MFCGIWCIILFLFVLLVSLRLYVSHQLVRNLIAATLCSNGWQESFGIIVSVVVVVVGFL
jgi:hypothetical protein